MNSIRTPLGLALFSIAMTIVVILTVGGLRLVAPRMLLAQANRLAVVPSTPALSPGLAEEIIPATAVALQPTFTSSPTPTVQPTATPLPTFTASPTFTPWPTVTPLPTATPLTLYQPAQTYVELTGFSHMWQTWNNCGPATLAMNLSYYGSTLGQADTGAVLRPNPEDKNVSPEELATFARTQGYQAQVRVNGNTELMRTLLSNNIPVIIETWLEPHPNDGMGHYRMLVGYDDAAQTWFGYDSYYKDRLIESDGAYRGIYMPYAETDPLWGVFNRTYVLVYSDAQTPVVQAILGAEMDTTVMWQTALQQAEAVVAQSPSDAFAWFNLGTNRTALGDYAGAVAAYDQARAIGLPWRMFWYQFSPFQAYHAVGRQQTVIELADATLAVTATIEELFYWKGQALAALGDVEGARSAMQRAVVLNSGFALAQEALATISAQ